MATTPTFSEEECLNVYWKVQNFSFWWKIIVSPDFFLSNRKYNLYLWPESERVKCDVRYFEFTSRGSETIMFLSNCQITILRGEEFVSNVSSGHELTVQKDIFEKRGSAFLPDDTLTIRCRIPTISGRGNLFLRSRIEVKHRNYLWVLKNFTTAPYFVQKSIEKSSQFGNMKLNLNSLNEINDFKQIPIEISRKGGEGCYCVFKIFVLDTHGDFINFGSREFFLEDNNSQIWSFASVFEKNKLLALKDLLLPNDTLTLKCDFALSLGTVSNKDCVYSFYEDGKTPIEDLDDISIGFKNCKCSNSSDLQADFQSMLDDVTLCDATIRVDSEIIRVHKTILSARSPVFKSMFATDMKEAIESTVVVSDLDVGTVRQLLVYMYTNTVQDEQWDSISRLYVAADKYQVLGLKQKCASFLKANLTVSNVCEALVLADLHQDENMKKGVVYFLHENNSEVLISEKWAEVEKNYSSLAIQVLQQICSNKRLRLN